MVDVACSKETGGSCLLVFCLTDWCLFCHITGIGECVPVVCCCCMMSTLFLQFLFLSFIPSLTGWSPDGEYSTVCGPSS